MSLTAAAWLAETSVSRRVLALFSNVRETLTGWANYSGDTWSLAWPSQTSASGPSTYRAISDQSGGSVWLDDAAVSSPSDVLVTCLATPNSYFYDEATETLYLHFPVGTGPDDYRTIGIAFKLFFSTDAFADALLWEPRIAGPVPTIEAQETDLTLGLTTAQSGELALNNADGLFDAISVTYQWHNASVSLLVGGGEMAFADYIPAGTLQIVGMPAAGDNHCVFQLRDFGNQTRDRVFPLHTFDDTPSTDFASLTGQFMPMLWGTVYDIPTTLLETDGDGQANLLVHDPLQTATAEVTEVRAVDRSTGVVTTLAAGSDWTFGAGLLVISATYPATTYDFRVDCNTVADDMSTIGQIASDILTLIGVTTHIATAIDTAAFAAADLDCPARMGLYVAGGAAPGCFIACGDLLRTLEQSATSPARISIDADGYWTISLYDPSIPIDAPLIPEELLTQFDAVSDILEPMARAMRVLYAHRVAAGSWSTTTATREAEAEAYQTEETLTHETCLVDAADAQLLAARLAWINSVPTVRRQIDGPPALFSLMPRDKVRVTRGRAPSSTGSWPYPGAGMEIESISKRPSDARAGATIGNMRGIGDVVKQIAPDYADVVRADAPTAYWRFEDVSGLTLLDDTGDYPATLASATGITYGVAGALTGNNKGIGLAGTQGAATFTPVPLPADYSLEVWFKFPSDVVAPADFSWATIIADESDGFGLLLYRLSGADIRIAFTDSEPVGIAVLPDTLYHLVIAVNADGTDTYYLNGVEVLTATLASQTQFSELFDLSGFGPGKFSLIDEIAIYPTALTETQVAAHYMAGTVNLQWSTATDLEKATYAFVVADGTAAADARGRIW